MTPKTLRVRARGTASVPNYEAQENGTRSFIGRQIKEISPGQHAFVPTGETQEVPYRSEYVLEVQAGNLWPADQATAEACSDAHHSIAFDPHFGAKGESIPPAAPHNTSGKG